MMVDEFVFQFVDARGVTNFKGPTIYLNRAGGIVSEFYLTAGNSYDYSVLSYLGYDYQVTDPNGKTIDISGLASPSVSGLYKVNLQAKAPVTNYLVFSITHKIDEASNIVGTDGRDHFDLFSLNDTANGGAGDDIVFAGSGDDHIFGGIGVDTIYGELGNDSLSGDDGDDSVSGGEGSDSIFGGNGSDVLNGDAGNDSLFGGDGGDTVLGGQGDDYLSGGAGRDSLSGGDGKDTLSGGEGSDLLYYSTSGDIRIDGGGGVDAVLFRFPKSSYIFDGNGGVRGVSSTDGVGYISSAEIGIFSVPLQASSIPFMQGIKVYALSNYQYTKGFSETFYIHNNSDVAEAVRSGAFASGADHYTRYGNSEGRASNPFFDMSYYLAKNPDVAAAVRNGLNAYEHYMTYGWREGRDPSPFFDTSGYLSLYTDVASAGINPLLHFLDYGIAENRNAVMADWVWLGVS